MAFAAIPEALSLAMTGAQALHQASPYIQKYVPKAAKVVSQLFKAHRKSPKDLFNKLKGTRPKDVFRTALKAGKTSAEVLADASSLTDMLGTHGRPAQQLIQSGQKHVSSFNEVLNRLHGGHHFGHK